MNINEFTALVRLFQACSDPALRRRAIELVPELREWEPQRPPMTQAEVDRFRPRTITSPCPHGHPNWTDCSGCGARDPSSSHFKPLTNR